MKTEMPADLSRLVEEAIDAAREYEYVRQHGGTHVDEWEETEIALATRKQALLAAIAEIAEENRRLKNASLSRD